MAGYVIRRVPGSWSAGKPRWFYEHRAVMEAKLGRRLEAHEHVHHLNGDKKDNRPENLALVDPREHTRQHKFGVPLNPERLARICALLQEGRRQRDIARELGIDPSTVSKYISRHLAAGRAVPALAGKGGQ